MDNGLKEFIVSHFFENWDEDSIVVMTDEEAHAACYEAITNSNHFSLKVLSNLLDIDYGILDKVSLCCSIESIEVEDIFYSLIKWAGKEKEYIDEMIKDKGYAYFLDATETERVVKHKQVDYHVFSYE